jgi:hypothetical protein
MTRQEANACHQERKQCRGLGHHWTKFGAIEKIGKLFQARVRCNECATIRTTELGRDGHYRDANHNKYAYSEGYLTPGFKFSKAEARVAVYFGEDFNFKPKAKSS